MSASKTDTAIALGLAAGVAGVVGITTKVLAGWKLGASLAIAPAIGVPLFLFLRQRARSAAL